MAISSQPKVVTTVEVFFLVVVALVVADVVVAIDIYFTCVCSFVVPACFFLLCFACVHKCVHLHGVQYQMLECKRGLAAGQHCKLTCKSLPDTKLPNTRPVELYCCGGACGLVVS